MPKVIKYKTRALANAKDTFDGRYREKDDTITFEEFCEMSQLNCYYCGAEPSNEMKYIKRKMDEGKEDSFIYNGLDRFDNSKPHTKENCVPCCKYCNISKNNLTAKEFFSFIKSRVEIWNLI